MEAFLLFHLAKCVFPSAVEDDAPLLTKASKVGVGNHQRRLDCFVGSLYFLIVILWRIRLFGGPVLEGNGRVVKHFRSAKCAALLAYLALHHERPCPREALIEALWP